MNTSLGKSLQHSKRKNERSRKLKYRAIVEADRDAAVEAEAQTHRSKPNELKSIWHYNDLEQFLSSADAREEGYHAERDVRVVIGGNTHILQNDKVVPQVNDTKDWLKLSEELTMPHRPQWSYNAKPEAVQAAEQAAFLDWRRALAQLEENHKVILTPYEKNLEVWRQLWRVIERADIVVSIVDARNPLLFRCRDFEQYVRTFTNAAGQPKKLVILLNKADLLTEAQRKEWAAYLTQRGDSFVFFSAKPLEEAAAPPTRAEDDAEHDSNDSEASAEEGLPLPNPHEQEAAMKKLHRNKKAGNRHRKKVLRAPVEVANAYELADKQRARRLQPHVPKPAVVKPRTEEEIARDARLAAMKQLQPWSVLDPTQLLDHFAAMRAESGVTDDGTPLMLGLVGYPNVGKSSTINAIIGSKKVVVSATPGKTKHLQTLVIPNERRVGLCDCPGLVFPSFASTHEQMVCDGILPADTLSDAVQAAAVLCRRLPRQVLEAKMNVSLAPEDDVDESHSLAERLLNTIARRRGYMAAHDRPNRARAAKELLKLYVDGHLTYVEPPPSFRPAAEAMSLQAYEQQQQSGAAPPAPKGATGGGAGDGDDDDFVDWNSDEEDAWADLDDADEARALSDHGDDESTDSQEEAAPPMFYARPHGLRHTFTRQEFFNLEANEACMAAKKMERRRKKRTNHQLDPDLYTFINEDGEVELRIDDDDGVLELATATGAPLRPAAPKPKTKKQQRRELKRMGLGPAAPFARRVGVDGY